MCVGYARSRMGLAESPLEMIRIKINKYFSKKRTSKKLRY